MIRNPFIVLRVVVFFFLLYLNVLAMVVAAWNVVSLQDMYVNLNGAPIFVIFNACCILFYVPMSLAEIVFRSSWAPKVMFECASTAILGILQLACAIDVTINGPTVQCQSAGRSSACASSALLTAITWISSTLLLLYFLALVGTAAAHTNAYPALWGTPITSVSWFVEPRLRFQMVSKDIEWDSNSNPVFKGDESPKARATRSASPASGSTTAYSEKLSPIRGLEISLPQCQSVESFRPNWAKDLETRRGVDRPFIASPQPPDSLRFPWLKDDEPRRVVERPFGAPANARSPTDRLRSYWSASTNTVSIYSTPAPPLPAKARTFTRGGAQHTGNGEYVVDVRNDSLPVITPSPSRPISYGIFPDDVQDPDAPIEYRHRSEWISAEVPRTRGVRTRPEY